MKTKYVIGLNSGTSFDGIDVALVKFKKNDLTPIFIDGIVCDYPRHIKEKIYKLIIGAHHDMTTKKLSRLDIILGNLFANAALKIIKKNKLKKEDVLLIASHGQTIYHKPKVKSIQIGNGKIITKKIGIKTINNFREGDIKAGGEGAPLMPYLDWIIFNKSKNIKAVLNIGGISNVTVVGKNIIPIAFDIGPGNALIDLIAKKYFRKDFDLNGNIASKGKIDLKSIEIALKDPYFKKRPPKSTGKEYFNQEFIDKYFLKIKNKQNKIATVTYFTTKVIEQSFRDFIFPKYAVKELVVSGGGVKNKTLMRHLTFLVGACWSKSVRITISDKYKLPTKYKEAILFALLGYTCHLRKKNNMPSCTGAKKEVILGKIINVSG